MEMDEEEIERQRFARAQMYQIVVPIFVGMSCLGVLANATVVFALRATKVRNATVTLILSLTISDIWTSSIVALSLVCNSYLPAVKNTRVDLCFSLTLEMLRTGGLITGILHLLLIAIHHYIGIVRPYTSKSLLKRIAQRLCLGAWLAPSAALFALAASVPDEGFWNCEHVSFYYTRAFRWTISGMLTTIFIIITSAYIRLLRILSDQRKKWRSQQLYCVAASAMINAYGKPRSSDEAAAGCGCRRHTATKRISTFFVRMDSVGSVPNLRAAVVSAREASLRRNILAQRERAHSIANGHCQRAGRARFDEPPAIDELSDGACSEPDAQDTKMNDEAADEVRSLLNRLERSESRSGSGSGADARSDLRFGSASGAGAGSAPLKLKRQSDWNPPSEWNAAPEQIARVAQIAQQVALERCASSSVESACNSIGGAPPRLSSVVGARSAAQRPESSCASMSRVAAGAARTPPSQAVVEKRAVRENRTLWTTIFICSSFFLGWAPATVLFTLTCETCTLYNSTHAFVFAFSCTQLCFILAKSLVNPLIYSMRIPEVDSEIRKVIRRLIRRICCTVGWFEKKKWTAAGAQSASRDSTYRSAIAATTTRLRCVLADSPTESLAPPTSFISQFAKKLP